MESENRSNLCNSLQASSKQDNLIFRASTPGETYGFRYFDKPIDYDEEDEEEDEYEEKSCGAACCDRDCECDDCLRCSDTGLREIDSYAHDAAAA